MSTRNQINRLNIRPQLLRRNGTNPPLSLLMHRSRRNHMVHALSVNLKLQLDHIAQSLHTAAENLLTVRLGADTLRLVAGEEELEDGVFVVQVSHAVGDDGAFEGAVGERAGCPVVFLDFALGGFYLCCAGALGGVADEFATGGNANTSLVLEILAVLIWNTHLPPSLPIVTVIEMSAGLE